MYYIYILLCSNKSYYVGYTTALKNRYKQHCWGLVKYTKNRRPLKLIFSEEFNNKEDALKREKQLKGWSRKKKEKLIELKTKI